MIDTWTLALVLTITVVSALFSLRLGVTVAIIEIVLGMIAGSFFGLTASDHEWLVFLAGLGSIVLTFLAGAEIDPDALKKTWKASTSIGMISFLAPFLGALLFAYYVLGWSWDASLITGVALSTTSVAVVYVVLTETQIARTATGKVILSACFITDLGTAIALSMLFTAPNWYMIVLVVALVLATVIVPRALAWLFQKAKGRSGELEIKALLLVVVLLGALAEVAGVHAVLPAYILGLLTARLMSKNREILVRMRTIALAFLTSFFFITAGTYVSLTAVASGIGIVLVLFLVKVGFKFGGVLPVTRRFIRREAVYTTLLMSTGLTFGTISAQFGLSTGIIDVSQFSILVMTVLLTAIVPTIIAQRYYTPKGA
jgi:Kef-type K+ transport system membrane component KefB